MRPAPRVPPFDRPATHDDLARLPDIVVAEIVAGELHASEAGAEPFAEAALALADLCVD